MNEEKQEINSSEVGNLADVLGPQWIDGKPAKATRAEAEKHIRITSRYCRGNILIPAEEHAGFVAKLEAAKTPADEAKLVKELEDRHAQIHDGKLQMAMAEVGSETGQRARIHNLIFGYADQFGLPQPCGADDNSLILSEPLDGKSHTGKCPRCGSPKSWQPAAFEITD